MKKRPFVGANNVLPPEKKAKNVISLESLTSSLDRSSSSSMPPPPPRQMVTEIRSLLPVTVKLKFHGHITSYPMNSNLPPVRVIRYRQLDEG